MSRFGRLTCAIRGHVPAPGAAWNHGYAFAHCLRCGTPIMRAVFGRWRPPPAGYRIVWPDRRGAFAPAAGTPAPPRDWDFMADEDERRRPPRDAFAFDDFMAEDSDLPRSGSPRRRRAH